MADYSGVADKILEQADIADIIGGHIDLKPQGANFIALCPFHQDKRPSLHIVTDKQIYKCFSCGAGGNVINFVREYEKLSFPDAIKQLATRYNIALDNYQPAPARNQQQVDYQQRLLLCLQQVNAYFQAELRQQTIASNYVHSRQITPKIVQVFGLGFAPTTLLLPAISQHTKEHAIDAKQLVTVGLIYPTKHTNRFSHRLIFPIHNVQGQIIGFGGRALSNQQRPKYLNSPETQFFQKSQVLYGLYQALQVQA